MVWSARRRHRVAWPPWQQQGGRAPLCGKAPLKGLKARAPTTSCGPLLTAPALAQHNYDVGRRTRQRRGGAGGGQRCPSPPPDQVFRHHAHLNAANKRCPFQSACIGPEKRWRADVTMASSCHGPRVPKRQREVLFFARRVRCDRWHVGSQQPQRPGGAGTFCGRIHVDYHINDVMYYACHNRRGYGIHMYTAVRPCPQSGRVRFPGSAPCAPRA